jgi:RND family efflux transporter MFP subunit
VRASISGHLTGLTDATEGTLVNQNTLIGKIMDYSQVLVDLKIPNSQIVAVTLGQTVRVRNYAFPDRTFSGRTTGVDPALDPATRTFRVVATVENPELLLRPGMFVEAEIVTESREDVVLVPRELVLTRRNRKVVFVEEEGRAQMRDVETGLEDRERVEILEGVDTGERLITSNYETLRPRTRVRVTGTTGG